MKKYPWNIFYSLYYKYITDYFIFQYKKYIQFSIKDLQKVRFHFVSNVNNNNWFPCGHPQCQQVAKLVWVVH